MSNVPLVDLKAQYAGIKDEIDTAIARVIANTSFVGGKEVSGFEAAFAKFQGTKRAVGVASGTGAIYLALKVLGVSPGDEVITTAHTFIATAEPIELLGAKTVLVDIDPVTYNIDPAKIEAAITPATKVIMPVHLYGQIAPMDEIMAIANRHNIPVVEDAAQAHGAEYHGHRAGYWGVMACFSFYPGKNLGAYGDGGAVCTNDDKLADAVAKLRDHGRTTKYSHDIIGHGERLDSLQAAILAAKLPHLDEWNAKRRQHAAYYTRALKGMNGAIPPTVMDDASHIYHIYCVRLEGVSPEKRDAIKDELNKRGIGAGIHYPIPIHLQPCMAHRGWKAGDFPVAEAVTDSIISLPIYPELEPSQLNQVVEDLSEILNG